jgi:hypothetical protein
MFVGRIYKIKSRRHSQVYIGSTRKLLATRFAEHCAEYEKYKRGQASFVTSFELIKLGDAWIELIHEDTFENDEALRMLEQYHIDRHGTVNRNRAYSSEAQKKATRIANKRAYNKEQLTCHVCNRVMRRDSLKEHKKSHINGRNGQ